jgi:hypothetical protein
MRKCTSAATAIAAILLCLAPPVLFATQNSDPSVKPANGSPSSVHQDSKFSPAQKRAASNYYALPLSFEPATGERFERNSQRFISHGPGYLLQLNAGTATLSLDSKKGAGATAKRTALRMSLVGANQRATGIPMEEMPSKSNYYIGRDPSAWRTNVPNYARVKYGQVYPGVDLVYYGNHRQLEYDFVVAPGADPNSIQLQFTGTRSLRVDPKSGNLLLASDGSELVLHKPIVYQPEPGPAPAERHLIDGRYVLASNHEVTFHIADYDHQRPLVIDPVLAYSTYFGGSGDENIFQLAVLAGVAVDTNGNAFIVGSTASTNLPTSGAVQGTLKGGEDAFIAKFSSSGALSFATYFGGSGVDVGTGIAVDSSGNPHFTGFTSSSDFPTVNAVQSSLRGTRDAFVAILNSTGSGILFSTYLGGAGADQGNGIAVANNNTYVVGTTASSDFPVTSGVLQHGLRGSQGQDAFVAMYTSGNALAYATYLGGTQDEVGQGIAADSSGNAYVVGQTKSTDFPATSGSYQKNCALNSFGNCSYGSAFVAKVNPTGSALVFASYLGGGTGAQTGNTVAFDKNGNVYVGGVTSSSDFPLANAIQSTNHGGQEGFVTGFNSPGTALLFSTYLGGSASDAVNGIAVDSTGVYVTGTTASINFPTANPIQGSNHGGANGYDAFMTKLNLSGSSLIYSTYFGGSQDDHATGAAIDGSGNLYVTGATASSNLTVANAHQATNHGGYDAFLVKISGGIASRPVVGDYDGDHKTDVAIFRRNTGTWYIIPSANPSTFNTYNWGITNDVPLLGDFDGDGKSDVAVWRPSSGIWYYIPSTNPSHTVSAQWGTIGDIPVPGDYDGDGKTDFAIFRPSDGFWYVIPSANPSSSIARQWGASTDIPVPADYDGDGKTDFAVFRLGFWYIIPSGNPSVSITTQWGTAGDIPVPEDYDGDHKADLAVFRPSTGQWFVMPSTNPASPITAQWGVSTDVPVARDYMGLGHAQIAVWRPSSGFWYILNGSSSIALQWGAGQQNDLPVQRPVGQ